MQRHAFDRLDEEDIVKEMIFVMEPILLVLLSLRAFRCSRDSQLLVYTSLYLKGYTEDPAVQG